MGVEDLIKHIRPEAFRRVLEREGWKMVGFDYRSESWADLLGDRSRFFTFCILYFGPDECSEEGIQISIEDLASHLTQDPNELITQLLDHSFQIYAELEDVVQRVSSYGGAGGLSVNEVLPDVFEGKLKWAIEDAARYRSLGVA